MWGHGESRLVEFGVKLITFLPSEKKIQPGVYRHCSLSCLADLIINAKSGFSSWT